MFPRLVPALSAPQVIRRLRRLPEETGGGVAIMFALMLVALCLFVGAAVDIGRWVQARHQTIAAMDAAVLAGGRVLQIDETNLAGARAAALAYYQANTRTRAEVIEDTVAFDAVDGNTGFAATGNAYLKTTFLGFANIYKLPVLDVAQAEYSKASLKAGGNKNEPSEIAMMLDITGSMGDGTKIADLKAAAADLVKIVIANNGTTNPVRVALVPFAEGVRLPSSMNQQVRGTPGANFTRFALGRNWDYAATECVVERTGANKYTDAAPGPGNYMMTLFNTTIAIYVKGKCGISQKNEIVPLTNDKVLLEQRIQNLELSGGTAGQVGTAWAWYTLSPSWNGLWPAASAAAAYGSKVRKIAILMTDGEYNIGYDANGLQFDMPGAGAAVNGDSPTQARTLCTNMKAKGITIYTVGFALGGNATAISTLAHCATDPSKAYTIETGSELKQAFREIALKINTLHLTQ